MNGALILYASKREVIEVFFIAIGFILGGLILLKTFDRPGIGWLSIIFGSIGLIAVLFNFVTIKSSYLRLSMEGLEIHTRLRTDTIAWEDIEGFRVDEVGGAKFVMYDYSTDYKKQKVARDIAQYVAGTEGMLSGSYGKKPEELVVLLNEWREKYSKK